MDLALEESGLNATDIDNVNAHATGTVQGDEAKVEPLGIYSGAYTCIKS
jgi:3-oxoacyl-[acyl-carrier-protein] synthase II